MSAPVDVLAVLDYEIQMVPLSTEDFGPQREQDVRDLREARAAVAELIAGYEQIKHSIQQARAHGNDWRRELALIENTADAALARVKGGDR